MREIEERLWRAPPRSLHTFFFSFSAGGVLSHGGAFTSAVAGPLFLPTRSAAVDQSRVLGCSCVCVREGEKGGGRRMQEMREDKGREERRGEKGRDERREEKGREERTS